MNARSVCYLSTAVLSVCLGLLSSAHADLNSGLIALYPFDGNANDASGNGLNGTIWNSPTFVTGPTPGAEAVYLVGQGEYGTNGQHVTIPSIDLSVYSAFTISLWANLQDETTSDGEEGVVSIGQQDQGFGPVVCIGYYSPGSQLDFIAGNARISPSSTYLNQWHRYTLVYSDGVLTAYLDTQELGSTSGSMVSSAGNAGMGIHWWSFSPGVSTRLVGSLSDVRIYNRALTITEIQELYSGFLSSSFATLTANPISVPADGTSACTATLTLRDVNGNPVTGKAVTFYAAEINSNNIPVAGSLSFTQTNQTTDANGQATAPLTANTPGTVIISAKDTADNVLVQQAATLTFTPTLQTVVPPNTDLQNAITLLYQGAAQILDGTPTAYGNNLSAMAVEEGDMGHYFWNAAGAEALQIPVDTAFYVLPELAGNDQDLLKALAIGEGLTVANGAVDTTIIDQLVIHDNTTSGGILNTRGQNVSGMSAACQQTLLTAEQYILSSGVPAIANTNSILYSNELNRRSNANLILQAYHQQLCSYYAALTNASLVAAQQQLHSLPTTLLKNVTMSGGSTFLSTEVLQPIEQQNDISGIGADLVFFYQDELGKYEAENNYLAARAGVAHAISGIAEVVSVISNNVVSAYAEVAQGVLPNPVQGQILNPVVTPIITNILINGTFEGSPSTSETVPVISDWACVMTVTNSGTSTATFTTLVLYSVADGSLGVPIIESNAYRSVNQIAPGQTTNVAVDMFGGGNTGGDPSTLSQMQIYLLGQNGSGMFFVDWKTLNPPFSSSVQIARGQAVQPVNLSASDTTNNSISIGNPVTAYVNPNLSNQTYQAQIWVYNPFVLSLTATVTQSLPPGITVLSTDGTLQSSSIVWTKVIAASNAMENTFAFSLSAVPGVLTSLPPAIVVFSDTNNNSLALEGVSPYFSALFPVQVGGSVPVGVSGVDSPMSVTVTNLTSTNQTGSLTISLTDSTGTQVTNLTQSLSVSGSGSSVLTFPLPGSLPVGSYSLTGSLSINGGMGQVLAGVYVLPLAPVTLGVGSPAMSTNGFNIVLSGTAGTNYLIEATSDLSNPTNWQPIMYFPMPYSPFSFTDPSATNYNQRFYRATVP